MFNFRPALGLKNRVYRCGSTDGLATVIDGPSRDMTDSERIFLNEITLNVDLRSKREIDQEKVAIWTTRAPGGPFVVKDKIEDTNGCCRVVFRSDFLTDAMQYMDKHWLSDIPPEVLQNHSTGKWVSVAWRDSLKSCLKPAHMGLLPLYVP